MSLQISASYLRTASIDLTQFAAPSSERAISLWQLQATSLDVKTRAKYLTTIMAFYDYCELHSLPWSTASMVEWLPQEAMKIPGRVLAQSTMEQKASHINFLATLHPPLISGGTLHPKRLLQAIGKLSPKVYKDKVLPLYFLIELSHKLQPTLMQVSIQLQTLLGLRGGHFCLLKPCAFMGDSLLLPPFKFQKNPVLICILHVPMADQVFLVFSDKSICTHHTLVSSHLQV